MLYAVKLKAIPRDAVSIHFKKAGCCKMKAHTMKHSIGKRLKLLSVSTDAKTVKGEKFGILTAILYLAPSIEAQPFVGRKINLCPHASKGCSNNCIFFCGRGKFPNVVKARIRKTVEFLTNRKAFINTLYEDLRKFEQYCVKRDLIGAVRLNGTSDLPWHNLIRFEWFERLRFYDYTKDAQRVVEYLRGNLPSNYHLTFSKSESNDLNARKLAKLGANIAVVFESLPDSFFGKRVINGDESDTRFLDPKGVIVGLTAKGPAKKDTSGFVVRSEKLNALSA